jgi:O-antigen ligase
MSRLRSWSEGGLAWIAVCFAAVLVGRASATSPKLALALIGLIALSMVVLARKTVLLIEMTIVALIWGSSTLPLVSIAYPLKFAMFGVMALAATAVIAAPHQEHLPIPAGFTVAFAAILALALASWTWSIDPSFTLGRTASMILLAGAVCVGVPVGLRSADDIKRIYFTAGLTLGAVSALGLVLGAAGIVTAFQNDGRYQGILVNANTLGYFAAPLLPAVVVLAAGWPPGRRRQVLIASAVVTAMGIALSGSRGGTAASVIGIAAGLMAAAKVRGNARSVRRILVITAAVFVAAGIVFPLLGRSARTGGNGTEGFLELGTGSSRTISWLVALPTILEQPVIGHGFGTTPIIYPSLQSHLQGIVLGGAHDGYIEASLELGLGGGLAVLILAGSGVVAAVRLTQRGGQYTMIGPVLLAAIVGGMVESVVETGMMNAGGLFAFPFWMAVALAHSLRVAERRAVAPVSEVAR